MIYNQFHRMLHQLAETQRKQATGDRMGTVAEVKQEGNEQKIRVEIGVDPDGKPLLGPWMNTVDKRGATREQHQYKKGQNVRISGDDYRQATVSAWSEGESFPQPDNAPEHGYGDSYQAGKLHTGKWLPEDDEEQQQGGQGGGGNPNGGGQEKNHRHEVWIAKEDNKPPKHSGKSQVMNGGGGQQKPGEQKKEKKKLEEAVMVSTDEKNGYTARVGKDVRVAAHKDGAKTRAGKTYFVAQKDKDAIVKSPQTAYVLGDSTVQVTTPNPRVSRPWIIGSGSKEDPVPNDDKLGNKKKSS
jgi:hypothetical protein